MIAGGVEFLRDAQRPCSREPGAETRRGARERKGKCRDIAEGRGRRPQRQPRRRMSARASVTSAPKANAATARAPSPMRRDDARRALCAPQPRLASVERQAQQQQSDAECRDRADDEGGGDLESGADQEARRAAIAREAARRQRNIGIAGELGREIEAEKEKIERRRRGGRKCRDVLSQRQQRAEQNDRRPGRRADEHADRPDELKAAHRQKPRQQEQLDILHVAAAPAQIAAHEFEQRRRIFLIAAALDRQHAHLIAGAPHQRRLDLVVRENMPVRRKGAADRNAARKARCAPAHYGPRRGRNRRAHQAAPIV